MSAMLGLTAILFISMLLIVWSTLNIGIKGWRLYESVFTESTDSRLRNLFLFTDSRRILFVYVSFIFALPVAVYLLGGSVIYVVLVVFAVCLSPKYILSRMEKKRRRQISEALPDALAQMSGAMRAGSTLATAIEAMVEENKGPISQEFSLVLREQRLGSRLEDALDNLGERVLSEEMDLVISAALIARDVGGNLAEIFHRLSGTIRRKLEMEGKINALTAQGILQGWVVSLLPFGILFALSFIEPEAIHPIFSSLLGWIFLGMIIVFEVAGGLMIKKIVTIDI